MELKLRRNWSRIELELLKAWSVEFKFLRLCLTIPKYRLNNLRERDATHI